jgi:hypothetical protein
LIFFFFSFLLRVRIVTYFIGQQYQLLSDFSCQKRPLLKQQKRHL